MIVAARTFAAFTLRSLGAGVAFAALGAGPLAAQQPPDTEIYLAPLRVEGGVARVGAPVNVTNRPGYDNQPSFTRDGRALLYTSQRDGQTDIYRYDIGARTTAPLTRTPESEYSPAVTPDGRWVTMVRVETDSAQRLWRFPLDGRGDPQQLLRDVKPVGYYAWADATTLALFVLGGQGAANTLQIARVRGGGRTDTVMRGIGRSLHRVPGTATVSFLHAAATPRTINVLDPATQSVRRVAEPLAGSEDFAWLDGERLLMARGDSLFQHGGGVDGWQEVASLGDVGAVTRLAVSPRGDWLAFVAQRPATAPAPDSAARDSVARDTSLAAQAVDVAGADDVRGAAGTPRNMPRTLRSSSRSGQWTPNPPPAGFHRARCAGVACSNRGYHASGVLMVRPSARSTTSVSSVHRTSTTRSPAAGGKVSMPSLQQGRLMIPHETLDSAQLV